MNKCICIIGGIIILGSIIYGIYKITVCEKYKTLRDLGMFPISYNHPTKTASSTEFSHKYDNNHRYKQRKRYHSKGQYRD
jgi:hypothetical protein